MLRKILMAGGLAAAFATVATASILLDVGAYEQLVEASSYMSPTDVLSKPVNLPHGTMAGAI